LNLMKFVDTNYFTFYITISDNYRMYLGGHLVVLVLFQAFYLWNSVTNIDF